MIVPEDQRHHSIIGGVLNCTETNAEPGEGTLETLESWWAALQLDSVGHGLSLNIPMKDEANKFSRFIFWPTHSIDDRD